MGRAASGLDALDDGADGDDDGLVAFNARQQDAARQRILEAGGACTTACVLDDPRTYAFSRLWLTFTVPGVQAKLDEANATDDIASQTTAAVPAMVIGCYCVAVAAERLVDDPRRHHDSTAGLALLGLALASSLLHLAIRVLRLRLPAALDVLLVALPLALASAALLILRCVFARPHLGYIFAMSMPAMMRRAPWMVQAAVAMVTVVAPGLVWRFYMSAYVAPVDAWASLAVVPVMVVVHRYSVVNAACAMHATLCLASSAAATARDRAALHHRLLSGLLPPHALPFARLTSFAESGPTPPEYTELWDGLSVLQVKLQMWARRADAVSDDFAPIAMVWHDVADAVGAVSAGALEIVQSTGDTFLVAGPFWPGASDEAKHAAAASAVELLRALHALLRGKCTFTAVATGGAAYGALLGAQHLTFRLFGPAVRESNALLEAAPRVVPFRGTKPCWRSCSNRNLAFAADSFRRLRDNYGVRPAAAGARRGSTKPSAAALRMSLAVGPWRDESTAGPGPRAGSDVALLPMGRKAASVASSDEGLAALAREGGGAALASSGSRSASELGAPVCFGPTALWRVRGVGASTISPIVLER
jgi:hypothetical protein